MSIRDLIKSMISCKRIFAFLIAFSIVLCSIGLQATESSTAEIIIKYICDTAEDGLTENGQEINPYEINSPLVVKNAVEKLGLDTSNIESICRDITVTPIVSTAEQEKYASWIEQFSDYENTEEEKKHTVYYSVTYKTSEGEDYAKRMLSAVISQYRLFYVEKYTYSSDITELSGEAAMQYDYYDTVDMLREKINSNIEYLSNIYAEGNNYHSPHTGYSVLDLAAEYKSLAEQELSVAERMIVESGITKNAWYLRNSLQNKVTDAQYEIDLNNQKAETQKNLMSVYAEKNRQYLWDNNSQNNEDGNESSQVRENVERDEYYVQSKSVYDNLALDYVKYRTDALNTEIDKQRYQNDINSFPDGFSDTALQNELEAKLESICASFSNLYERTKETIEDYNAYKSAKSIECISGVVVQDQTSTVFYYTISLAIALMLGVVISVLLGYMRYINRKKTDDA